MIVGLTGGIATGKSTAATALAKLGVHIVDCDVVAHYLADYSVAVRHQIRQHFGPHVFHPYGALDRKKLSRLAFQDAQQRAALEAILHPPILHTVTAHVRTAQENNAHLVVVVPLLFELGLEHLFDETWLIGCPPTAQLERLLVRDGYSVEEAQSRIATQWPPDKKADFASRVLNNDATIADFENTITSTWESLVKS